LNPQPYYLVKHFFSVALFGMSRLPLRKGLYGIWLAFMLLVTAVNIILPIVNAEGIRCEKRPHMHCMHCCDGFLNLQPPSFTPQSVRMAAQQRNAVHCRSIVEVFDMHAGRCSSRLRPRSHTSSEFRRRTR
jgi:hypothetical protein